MKEKVMIFVFNYFTPFFFSRIRKKNGHQGKSGREHVYSSLRFFSPPGPFFLQNIDFFRFQKIAIFENLILEISEVLAIICQYGRP